MRKFWHGGAHGLRPGDYLKSPDERRDELSHAERRFEALAAHVRYTQLRDPKRVYFTIDRNLARAWAVLVPPVGGGPGALYRVRPVPPASLQEDPDYQGVGFSARRAEILEVAEPIVRMSPDDAYLACRKYRRWDDGSPQYDQDGYFLPPPQHRRLGKSAEDYRCLGKWFDRTDDVAVVGGEIVVLFPEVGRWLRQS